MFIVLLGIKGYSLTFIMRTMYKDWFRCIITIEDRIIDYLLLDGKLISKFSLFIIKKSNQKILPLIKEMNERFRRLN